MVTFILVAVLCSAAGYAFRGLIAKELKSATAESKVVLAGLKAEVSKLEAAIKANI